MHDAAVCLLQTLQRKQSALLVQLDNLDQECAGLREEVAQVKLQRQKLEEELKDLRESQKHLQLLYEEKEASFDIFFLYKGRYIQVS